MGLEISNHWLKKISAVLLVTTSLIVVSCGKQADSKEDSEVKGITRGPFLSRAEVTRLVQQAGFPANVVPTAVAIAECESTFGIRSLSDSGTHYGLFQLSSMHAERCGGSDFFNPAFNARCAYIVYKNRGSFRDWVCYQDGSYAKFLYGGSSSRPVSSSQPSSGGRKTWYYVQSGDTAYIIAKKYGTNVSNVTSCNPGVNMSALKVGQRICIYQ